MTERPRRSHMRLLVTLIVTMTVLMTACGNRAKKDCMTTKDLRQTIHQMLDTMVITKTILPNEYCLWCCANGITPSNIPEVQKYLRGTKKVCPFEGVEGCAFFEKCLRKSAILLLQEVNDVIAKEGGIDRIMKRGPQDLDDQGMLTLGTYLLRLSEGDSAKWAPLYLPADSTTAPLHDSVPRNNSSNSRGPLTMGPSLKQKKSITYSVF